MVICRKRGNFEKLVDAREVEWDGEEKKDLLRLGLHCIILLVYGLYQILSEWVAKDG